MTCSNCGITETSTDPCDACQALLDELAGANHDDPGRRQA